MAKNKLWLLFLSLAAVLLLANGCSRSSQQEMANEPAKQHEPVTLNILFAKSITDEEFDQYILQPLHNKYPYITLNRVNGKLEDLQFAGQTPDIVYFSPYLDRLGVDGFPLDLTPLIKQYKMDLTRFDPALIDSIKKFGQNGQLLSIPFDQNAVALFYNKDLFDRAGVEYPKDGMSWNDAAELARKLQGKLTSSSDGAVLRALDPFYNKATNIGSPLMLNVYDPKTGKAIIDDKWKSLFQFMMDVYNIPGNKPAKLTSNTDEFVKGHIGMIPQFYNAILTPILSGKIQFNWDVAQYPDLPEAKGLSHQVDYHQFIVSSTSKHPDDAFRVIEVATAADMQLEAAKNGRIPVSTNAEWAQSFGTNVPELQGKNLKGLFKSKSAALIQSYVYNDTVTNELEDSFQSVFDGKADINTALRTAEEKANLAIAAQKSGQ